MWIQKLHCFCGHLNGGLHRQLSLLFPDPGDWTKPTNRVGSHMLMGSKCIAVKHSDRNSTQSGENSPVSPSLQIWSYQILLLNPTGFNSHRAQLFNPLKYQESHLMLKLRPLYYIPHFILTSWVLYPLLPCFLSREKQTWDTCRTLVPPVDEPQPNTVIVIRI